MAKRRDFVFICQLALLLSAGAWILAPASFLYADDVVVKKLVLGLGYPESIAIRPEGGPHSELFIGDGKGGRVLRVALDHPDVAEEAITGFPQHEVSKGKAVTWGIQSLYFLDRARLVVSGGDDKQPFVRLYELPDSASALQFDDQKQSIEVAAENRHELEKAGVTGFHSIVRPRANDHVGDMLLLAASSDQAATALWKIPLRANTLEDAVPFPVAHATNEIRDVSAVAVANSGYVTLAGTVSGDGGSHAMLRFVDPIDGRSRLDVFVDLEAILEMAYNPMTGDLFAVGLESPPTHTPGLYRLDDAGEVGKPRCRAKKIAALPLTVALAFGPDGTLFVTCQETKNGGEAEGALYRISGF